jgi:heme/copper-type cytochrome/quinol oxidase subunit 2
VTTTQVIELVVAAAIAVGGVWLYRRRANETSGEADAQYGSQGAVILFVVAAILLIHGLGWLEYHPSASELGQ